MSIPIALPATSEDFIAYQEQLIRRKLTAAEREVANQWLGIFNDVRTGSLDGAIALGKVDFLISKNTDTDILRFLTAAREWIVCTWKGVQNENQTGA